MTKQQFTTIDEYIALFPKEIQERMQQLRKAIKEAAPEAIETIAYKMPTFKLKHNLVYFGGFKNHIGFYPFPSGVEKFEELAKDYEGSGKGTIQFPHDKPLPLDLVKKVVAYRVQEDHQS